MLCGKPGSGKTYLAFGYLFYALEKHLIDRIVVFCNPVVAKDAAKLGFYPGTKLEKLMESQVGAILSSKLGDSSEVERLVAENKLLLVPAGDARGYEVPANSGVYIMESQNLTCDLLRMLL
jgi:phosphate starvation-inducible protein PhoH